MGKRSRSAKKTPVPAPAVVRSTRRPRPLLWVALGLAATACVLYAASWHYGFAGDDAFVILNNQWTRQGLASLPKVLFHSLYYGAVPMNGGLYRPVAGAYYVIVGAVVGLRPAGYHIAQVLLYGLNAAIVFFFLQRLTRASIAVPVIATLLFIAHPIHTEVVDNIKSADEMLCLAFFLTAAIAWLQYADTSDRRWRYLSIGAYALAVGSKETAVPMVIMLPALWYFFRARTARTSLLAAVPLFAVMLCYLVVRYLVLSSEPQTDIVTLLNNSLLATSDGSVRLASALAFLGRYIRMLLWPYPLSFDYTYDAVPLHTFSDPAVWISVAVLAGLGAVFLMGVRARRVEAFAALWFVASIVIVSNVLFLISTNFAERLLYLPSVVVCYVVAGALIRWARIGDDQPVSSVLRSPMVAATLIPVLAIGSLASVRRTRDWRDQLTLFAADVRKYPNSARLNSYVGSLLYFEGERLLREGQYPDLATTDLTNARAHLQRSLEISHNFRDIHSVLGMAEYRLKQYREAIPHLQQALEFKEYRVQALEMLPDAYQQLGMRAEAIEVFRRIDTEGIVYPPAWFQLGNDAAARGDDDASIRYFRRFIAAVPDNPAADFNLASAQYRTQDFAGSLASAEQCVALKPTPSVQASCLLLAADNLIATGRRAEAFEHFERARVLDPNNPRIKRD